MAASVLPEKAERTRLVERLSADFRLLFPAQETRPDALFDAFHGQHPAADPHQHDKFST